MPITNPVHYNSGTTLNNSISKNQISFGVNNVDYGPTSQTKWYANTPIYGYIIVSDSYSQGLTTQENSYPVFWGQSSPVFSNLYTLINGLPARNGQTPFTDIESAITWLEGEGIYGIQNRTYENIAVSGLTLLYDAGATLSYPTVNNQIYDLGSSNINGTLQNSPAYINTNGGYLNFSASSSQYITFNDLGTLSNFTVGCWFRLNSPIIPSQYPSLVTNTYGSGNYVNYTLGPIPSSDKISGGFFNTGWIAPEGFTPNLGEWYYVVVTYDGNTVKLYRNGLLFSEVASTASAISTGLGGRIGRRWDAGDYLDADISIVQIYNRAISYLEVYQNMSAQAARYSVPVPPIPYLSTSELLMIDSSNNNVYKYNFGTNTISTLFTATTDNTSSQITATQNKIFISDIDSKIYQYSYTPIPFEASFESSFYFTSGFTSGMTAVDNNTLIISSDKVYRYNISADTTEELFNPTGDIYAGITYNPVSNQLAVNYLNSGNTFGSVFGVSGTPISTIYYSAYTAPTYPDLQTNTVAITACQNVVYAVTDIMNIYQLDFENLIVYPPIQPSNLTSEVATSVSGISPFTTWPVPAPYFYY